MAHHIADSHARFTMLSPHLVRMEFAPSGRFEDRRSVRAMTRPEAVPFQRIDGQGDTVCLSTGEMILEYTSDGLPFGEGNLRAVDAATGEAFWHPGSVDERNLGGARLSMDYVKPGLIPQGVHPATVNHHLNGAEWNLWRFGGILKGRDDGQIGDGASLTTLTDEILAIRDFDSLPIEAQTLVRECRKYPPGLLSQSGYFLYNDTPTPLIDPDSQWVVERPADDGAMDLYLFYYRDDYIQGLRDGRCLFGPTPLIPRYALGLWYSRYPTFSEKEIYELVETFDTHELPLDMFVFDLEWHQRGWFGFDWDRDHIPTPEKLLSFLTERNIHTTFNVHPDRVPIEDSRFDRFCEEAGVTCDKEAVLPQGRQGRSFGEFDVSVPRHAMAFMDVLHKPIQDQGVDFWWIDGHCPVKDIAGLDSQLWTNHVYHEHIKATYPERRPMIFSRTPGFGAQRYPFHFTGDTCSYWEVLESQVEQTLRAGHMGQSFITHDVGGHMSTAVHIDPELYMRWVQFAVLSPVVRLHSSKHDEGIAGERRPWMYGRNVLESFVAAMQFRMALLPTLYTIAHQSHAEGVPMCRSNALQEPSWEAGFDVWTSYFLGDRIYAAPVVRPGTLRDVLLPPGRWINGLTNAMVTSDGETLRPNVSPFGGPPLHYVRAGSLLVRQLYTRRAAILPDTLVLDIYPDGEAWCDQFTLYEDDGFSQDHMQGFHTQQTFHVMQNGDGIRLEIGAREGAFAGSVDHRSLRIRVTGKVVSRCQVDGEALPAWDDGTVLTGRLDMRQPHVVRFVTKLMEE